MNQDLKETILVLARSIKEINKALTGLVAVQEVTTQALEKLTTTQGVTQRRLIALEKEHKKLKESLRG